MVKPEQLLHSKLVPVLQRLVPNHIKCMCDTHLTPEDLEKADITLTDSPVFLVSMLPGDQTIYEVGAGWSWGISSGLGVRCPTVLPAPGVLVYHSYDLDSERCGRTEHAFRDPGTPEWPAVMYLAFSSLYGATAYMLCCAYQDKLTADEDYETMFARVWRIRKGGRDDARGLLQEDTGAEGRPSDQKRPERGVLGTGRLPDVGDGSSRSRD